MPRPPLRVGTYGSINAQRLTPKSWAADTYYRDETGKRRRIQRRGPSKAAAVANLKAAIADGVTPARESSLSPSSRFRTVADAWHTDADTGGQLSTSTIRLYRDALDKHLYPHIGDLRLIECDVYRLGSTIKTVASLHGATTANRAHSVLRNVFKFAIANGITGTNPARDVPRVKIDAKPVVALSLEDARRLLAGLSDDCRMVALVQLTAGLRIGEALALRWQDVDLDAAPPRLSVNATAVQAPGRGYMRGKPKTGNSYRTIPIPRALAEELRAWRTRIPAHAVSTDWEGPEALLFPNIRGGVRDPNNYRKAWRSQTAEAGFPGLETHALRKTASTLIERVHGPSVAAEILGDTEAVARKHYIQRREMTSDVSDVMGGLLG